jgi:hypothetical protein
MLLGSSAPPPQFCAPMNLNPSSGALAWLPADKQQRKKESFH